MITLIKCEFMKTRHRPVFITALAFTLIGVFAGIKGDYSKVLHLGWRMWLYQMPLINALFLPFLANMVAAMLWGIEHKGAMLKQLCTATRRGSLYDAKLLFGLGIMVFCVLSAWGITLAYGCYAGFTGGCPIYLYLLYLLFTLVPTVAIYIFQHSLALLVKNPAMPFFTGMLGQFIGVFAMFLPSLPWLRRLLPWGYYGALQFVGMFGWTKEYRYERVHFDLLPIDTKALAFIVAMALIMYLTGKYLFIKKEV